MYCRFSGNGGLFGRTGVAADFRLNIVVIIINFYKGKMI